jgi:hypothetical protein
MRLLLDTHIFLWYVVATGVSATIFERQLKTLKLCT